MRQNIFQVGRKRAEKSDFENDCETNFFEKKSFSKISISVNLTSSKRIKSSSVGRSGHNFCQILNENVKELILSQVSRRNCKKS